MAGSEKGISVVYVSPWAHIAGHGPHAAIKETSALLKAGAHVSVCTFQGILDEKLPEMIPHRTVVSSWSGFPSGILTRLLCFLPKAGIFARFVEQLSTLFLAVRLRKTLKYDVIYLRDGNPFIFIPFLLGIVFRHRRWAISLIGPVGMGSPPSLASRPITAPMWKPIYRKSLTENRFIFVCQNTHIRNLFETRFLDGILSGRVKVVPMGVEKTTNYIPQREARRYLGLPEDEVIFLHFGGLHGGKDVETLPIAVKDVPNVFLIYAGEVTSSAKLINLVQHRGLGNRVIVKDYYVPEAEKQYYFGAADAIILAYKRDFLQTAALLWEAARFRLPTIASDAGELGELVKRYKIGIVFKAEDATSLRDAISDFLICSQSERETMRSNYEKFCDEFSLDYWAKKCIKIFTELCEHRSTER